MPTWDHMQDYGNYNAHLLFAEVGVHNFSQCEIDLVRLDSKTRFEIDICRISCKLPIFFSFP